MSNYLLGLAKKFKIITVSIIMPTTTKIPSMPLSAMGRALIKLSTCIIKSPTLLKLRHKAEYHSAGYNRCNLSRNVNAC